MSEELKPCPFCGGEASMESGRYQLDDGMHAFAHVECLSCGACGSGFTEAESTFEEVELLAADAWNRRAERTCRVESSHEVEGDGCYAYFEYELTCGHEIAWGNQLPPSYCPECGRRVSYDSDDYI